jgi:uncharacterized membrane protein
MSEQINPNGRLRPPPQRLVTGVPGGPLTLDLALDPPVVIRKRLGDAHWRWLAAGWRDLRSAPQPGLLAGFVVTALAMAVIGLLIGLGFGTSVPVAVGALALAGPIVATGLYALSRQIDRGEVPQAADALPHRVLPQIASVSQLAMAGFVLLVIVMVWARIAALLYAVTLGDLGPLAPHHFAERLLGTPEGLIMLVLGTAIGGAIALATYVLFVLSVPLMFARRIDIISAMILSAAAVSHNRMAMASFAFNIALMLALCAVTGLLALVFVFPWLGHATWRAYRDVMDDGITA